MNSSYRKLVGMIVLPVLCFVVGAAGAEVAKVPDDALGVTVRDGIKVVYHIKSAETHEDMSAGVHELLHLVEIYESLGIDPTALDIHAVFDGPAARFVVKDPDGNGKGNPNAASLAELAETGVHLEVCGQNLAFHGHTEEDLLPGVRVALGGQPRVIDLVLQGYAYFRY